MLHTCNKTEKPPNPNKKAHRIILVEISFIGIAATKFTPLVNSTIPDKIALLNYIGIPSKESNGLKIEAMLLNKWL